MKSIKTFSTFLLIAGIIFSCQKESDLFETMSHEDEEAVEGMEHALESAEIYNDSLIWCNENSDLCTKEFLSYCDSIFHHEMEEYNEHHEKYSHNNIEDDHHHNAKPSHHHGSSSGGHDEKTTGHGGDGHGHSIESHNMMSKLNSDHIPYHPN